MFTLWSYRRISKWKTTGLSKVSRSATAGGARELSISFAFRIFDSPLDRFDYGRVGKQPKWSRRAAWYVNRVNLPFAPAVGPLTSNRSQQHVYTYSAEIKRHLAPGNSYLSRRWPSAQSSKSKKNIPNSHFHCLLGCSYLELFQL